MDLADDFPCSAPLVEQRAAASAVCRWRARGRGPATWHLVRRWSRHRCWPARHGHGDAGGARAGRRWRGERRRHGGRAAGASERRARDGRGVLARGRGAERRPGRKPAWPSSSRSAPTTWSWRASWSRRWINEAHLAYRRAAASRAEGYHIALVFGAGPGLLAVEPAKEHAFVTAFPASWAPPSTAKLREAAVEVLSRRRFLACRSIKTLHNFAPLATDDDPGIFAAIRPKAERFTGPPRRTEPRSLVPWSRWRMPHGATSTLVTKALARSRR